MDLLKLIAFDTEDLRVVSAHLQDATVRVSEMRYLKGEQRFAAVLNRFDWAQAHASGRDGLARRQAALRFERVQHAKVSGIDLSHAGDVLVLLAISFEARSTDDPAGWINLVFAGDKAIQLEVECIEAELRDLGPVWRTKSKPRHPKGPDGVDGQNP
ncbi:MAG: DUF2948 family protein [Hyphomicrobiaceae bacterium]